MLQRVKNKIAKMKIGNKHIQSHISQLLPIKPTSMDTEKAIVHEGIKHFNSKTTQILIFEVIN